MNEVLDHDTETGTPIHEGLYGALIDKDLLMQAYNRISKNSGAHTPGVDGITVTEFSKHLDENLEQLMLELEEGSYQPQPARQVSIPKGNGAFRTLSIPTFRDRIVQEVVRLRVEPFFEPIFSQNSFAYRPGLNLHDAISAVTEHAQRGCLWVLEGDIEACFDSIDHTTLLTFLRKRVPDERLLELISQLLRAGVMVDNQLQATKRGAPQGAVISPLLANIYLHVLDAFIESGYVKSLTSAVGYVRYADDFVVMTERKQDAQMIQFALQAFLASALELTLSESKTKLTHLKKGIRFLGFDIRSHSGLMGRRVNVHIPKEASELVKAKVDTILDTDKASETKLRELNRYLSSWGHSYRRCDNALRVFRSLDNVLHKKVLGSLAKAKNMGLRKARRAFLENDVVTIDGLALRQLKSIVERTEPQALPELEPA